MTKTDAIVLYVELADGDPDNAGSPGAARLIAVRRDGTNTGAPTDGETDAATNNNPWLKLREVTVEHTTGEIESVDLAYEAVQAKVDRNNVSGGYYATLWSPGSSVSTGSTTITGCPFKPKKVTFKSYFTSGTALRDSYGVAVDNSGSVISYTTSHYVNSGADQSFTTVSDTHSVGQISGTGAWQFAGTVTSFDSDGVTVNITTGTPGFDLKFIVEFEG